ncbi:MAG: dTMP kinase [Leptolyngbyaceae cyanobacterium bins.349]|nr:dTMP kinase [Leptolyngbyaceae cyanobacterium bins.349]
MDGRFIVFEGGEGGGKTTQLARTYQWLYESGWFDRLHAKQIIRQIVQTREPGGTIVGRNIRQLLLEFKPDEPIQDRTELLLYAADRAQHVEGLLRPALADGALILCDRYTDSTVAYQGYGRQLDLSLIRQLNQIATSGLQSDLTVWLDLDPVIGLARTGQRGTRDRIEQANVDFHQRVHQGFVALAQQYPDRIIRIDAHQSEDHVARQIQTTLETAFARWWRVTREDEPVNESADNIL